MLPPSYLLHSSKFRQPISQISLFFPNPLSKFNLSLNFHHYAPSKPLQIDSTLSLLNHKDWLSQSQVIRIFQTLKDPNTVLPLLDHLSTRRDYKPTESLYATVVNKLALAKNFDGIESLMKRIKIEKRCRLSDGFFRNVIKIYAHSGGRINKAIETLLEMPDYKCWPRVETFNCVLNMLVSTKQFEVVHEVYGKASELGVEVDACCLNIMIKGLCECGEMESAFKVLDEFPKQKCRPNERTFATLMHGLCERGRVDDAFDLLERMEDEGVEADAIVFNALISGLRRAGRVDEGVELFDNIMLKGCDPNPGTFQEVLYCLLDAKRYGDAKCFMGRMIEKGINPSFESYKLAIQGFCSESVVEDVEWALRKMVGLGFVPKMGMWKQVSRCILSDKRGIVSACVSFEELVGK